MSSILTVWKECLRMPKTVVRPSVRACVRQKRTGYFAPSSASVAHNSTLHQACGPKLVNHAGCPSVANFSYGFFKGAKDLSVGYSPPFEPYWCGRWSGLSAMMYKPQISNGTEALTNGPSDAVLHMTRGTSDIWANFQWPVTSIDTTAHELKLGKGGWQFPRGTVNGHWFLDNAGIGALTAAGEWYRSADGMMIHMVGNGTATPPPAVMIAAQRTTVLKQVRTVRVRASLPVCLSPLSTPALALTGGLARTSGHKRRTARFDDRTRRYHLPPPV
jgi:hypothetical protein